MTPNTKRMPGPLARAAAVRAQTLRLKQALRAPRVKQGRSLKRLPLARALQVQEVPAACVLKLRAARVVPRLRLAQRLRLALEARATLQVPQQLRAQAAHRLQGLEPAAKRLQAQAVKPEAAQAKAAHPVQLAAAARQAPQARAARTQRARHSRQTAAQ